MCSFQVFLCCFLLKQRLIFQLKFLNTFYAIPKDIPVIEWGIWFFSMKILGFICEISTHEFLSH